MCDFDHVINSFIILMSLVAAVGQFGDSYDINRTKISFSSMFMIPIAKIVVIVESR